MKKINDQRALTNLRYPTSSKKNSYASKASHTTCLWYKRSHWSAKTETIDMIYMIINRPGVARAVLQLPSSLINSLIHSLIHPLVPICSIPCYSQTIRARELKFWENVHPTLCVMCHVSCVKCQVSSVTCHISGVACHFCLLFFSLGEGLDLLGGGSVINGAYPV